MLEPENPPQADWGGEPLAQDLGVRHPGLRDTSLSHTEGQGERQQDQAWDGRLMTFVASTGAADRNGNILDIEGWELENYHANPVVLFNHNWDLPPVGRTSRLTVEADRLLAQVEFAPTALGQELALLNADGYLRAISVGVRPIEWEIRRHPDHGFPIGIHSHRHELLELSIVAIPANPATVRAAAYTDPQETGKPLHILDHPAEAILCYLGNPRTAPFRAPADVRAFRDGGPSDPILEHLQARARERLRAINSQLRS